MSRIEWTDETWNPIVGCSKVSPGCDHCYAEKQAYRNLLCLQSDKFNSDSAHETHNAYETACAYEYSEDCDDLGVIGAKITKSYGWSGATALNVSALDKPRHLKKPRRIFVCSMSDLFHEDTSMVSIDRVFMVMQQCPQHTFQILTKRPMRMLEYLSNLERLGFKWPLPNVWIGVSAENQELADKRIPILLQCPAAVRFVSVEPMLGPVVMGEDYLCHDGNCAHERGLDWVICGCESGPQRREMSSAWASDLYAQCRTAEVPFFMKQMEWAGRVVKSVDKFYPYYLRVREFPEVGA